MLNQKEKLLFKAIIAFDKKANQLIKLLAKQFDLDLSKEYPFGKLIIRRNNLWSGDLNNDWKFRFHGDACYFENSSTGQNIDVKINRYGNYGTLHLFGLYQFIETTEELKYIFKEIDSEDFFSEILESLEMKNYILEIDEPPFSTKILNREKIITFLNNT